MPASAPPLPPSSPSPSSQALLVCLHHTVLSDPVSRGYLQCGQLRSLLSCGITSSHSSSHDPLNTQSLISSANSHCPHTLMSNYQHVECRSATRTLASLSSLRPSSSCMDTNNEGFSNDNDPNVLVALLHQTPLMSSRQVITVCFFTNERSLPYIKMPRTCCVCGQTVSSMCCKEHLPPLMDLQPSPHVKLEKIDFSCRLGETINFGTDKRDGQSPGTPPASASWASKRHQAP